MTATSTSTTTALPVPPFWAHAAWILAGRIVAGWRSQVAALVIGWLFPILITCMFLGLFGGALKVPGDGPYLDFLMPGMLAVTMLFGLENTTLAAAADAAKGVNDRFRSLPISATAIVLGRALADMLNSLIGLAIMIAFGLVLGWRPALTPVGAALALGLLLWLRFALLWVGISIGYRARSVESVAYVQILVWPVALLSSVFVDPATMPTWLSALVEANPVSATATTVRELVGALTWPGTVVPARVSAVLAFAWPTVLTAIFLPVAARSFREAR